MSNLPYASANPIQPMFLGRKYTLLAGCVVVLLAGLLAYNQLIFLPSWRQAAQANGYERGNLSDLYVRWLGTRVLLGQGQDPYSPEVVAVAQRGYYGRDALPGEQLPEAAVFAHPIYLVFLLAPLSVLPYPIVQELARWGLPFLVILGTIAWWGVIQPNVARRTYLLVALLALCAPPTLEVARAQQLTGLVYFLLAGAVLLLARGHPIPAGILLALSTIKPHETWGAIVVILVWALASWRTRRPVAISFGLSLTALFLGGLWLLPSWIGDFLAASLRYMEANAVYHVFARMLPEPVLVALGAGWVGLLLAVAWAVRREPVTGRRFIAGLACGIALTQIVLPTYLSYEAVYMLPVLLLLLTGAARYTRPMGFLLHRATVGLLFFAWLCGAALGYAALAGIPVLDAPVAVRFMPQSLGPILPYCAVLVLVPLVFTQAPVRALVGRGAGAVPRAPGSHARRDAGTGPRDGVAED